MSYLERCFSHFHFLEVHLWFHCLRLNLGSIWNLFWCVEWGKDLTLNISQMASFSNKKKWKSFIFEIKPKQIRGCDLFEFVWIEPRQTRGCDLFGFWQMIGPTVFLGPYEQWEVTVIEHVNKVISHGPAKGRAFATGIFLEAGKR